MDARLTAVAEVPLGVAPAHRSPARTTRRTAGPARAGRLRQERTARCATAAAPDVR
ncbi:hypothetical protein ACFW2Y_01655 [Streptomyces sp. NPDC058877]|uniref:hypothetical protein n=1 Tax=unclassified Streptomyces TaxID=2593676 RepID=UPI00369C1E1C